MSSKKSLASLVGSTVSLTTKQGVSIKGELFTYDAARKAICIRSEATAQQRSGAFWIIEQQEVQGGRNGIKIIKEVLDAELEKLPSIDYDLQKKMLADAQAKELRFVQTRGKGVTPEAQALFDFLQKMLPCEWEEPNMVVLDAVRVAPPYTVEACTLLPDKGDQSQLAYVIKAVRKWQASR